MNAVLRLILIVSLIFLIALGVTVYVMFQQASKDINREVLSNVSFTHRLLTSASYDDSIVSDLLTGKVRHVQVDLLSPEEHISKGPGSDTHVVRRGDVPEWFYRLIPNLEHLEDKQYFRYLSNGMVLRLQATTTDEVEEFWETIQDIVLLFLLSCLLCNCFIYIGIKLGMRPVSEFLNAIELIKLGRFDARLRQYKIREINELSHHFNIMAEELELAEKNNRRLTQQLMQVQEEERSHLARELHDDLGQYLTGIQAQAYLVAQIHDKPEAVKPVAENIRQNCEAMQVSFRQLIRDLHPVILEELGLHDAIHNLVNNWKKQNAIDVTLNLKGPIPDFGDDNSTHIFRILQESLNNIAKHSGADKVEITAFESGSRFYLSITDNGKGSEGGSHGLGMRSMRERAECLGGKLQFHRSDSGGVIVSLELPLPKGK